MPGPQRRKKYHRGDTHLKKRWRTKRRTKDLDEVCGCCRDCHRLIICSYLGEKQLIKEFLIYALTTLLPVRDGKSFSWSGGQQVLPFISPFLLHCYQEYEKVESGRTGDKSWLPMNYSTIHCSTINCTLILQISIVEHLYCESHTILYYTIFFSFTKIPHPTVVVF